MDKLGPEISVLVITYNHEKFIEQTLLSIVEQDINVPFEIVIGEDGSKDNTRKIIEEFIISHASVTIRLLPKTANKGMQKNLLDTYDACRGKYIAYCEGDDYWVDMGKLQWQYNYLENNHEYIAVAHNSHKLYENWNSPWAIDQSVKKGKEIEKISGYKGTCSGGSPTCNLTFDHFLYEKWPFHTASVFFRNIDVNKLPEVMKTTATPDKVLFTTLLHFGKFHFEDVVMGVYRIHEGGVTNSSSNSVFNTPYYLNKIETLSSFYGLTDTKDHGKIKTAIAEQYLQVAIYEKGGERIRNLLKALAMKPSFLFKKSRIILGILYRTIIKS